jgi:hypothetical protein
MTSPLGPKVQPKPAEPKPEWVPVPGKAHLEQNAKGQWRTRDYQPPKG